MQFNGAIPALSGGLSPSSSRSSIWRLALAQLLSHTQVLEQVGSPGRSGASRRVRTAVKNLHHELGEVAALLLRSSTSLASDTEWRRHGKWKQNRQSLSEPPCPSPV